MNKYAVRYCEILAKTIIAEADTYEEAEEKVQAAVDDCCILRVNRSVFTDKLITCHGDLDQ